MANAALNERTWIDQCVRLVRQCVPDVGPEEARRCAEEMARNWPNLPPGDAVARYFEHPRFEETDWSVFELK